MGHRTYVMGHWARAPPQKVREPWAGPARSLWVGLGPMPHDVGPMSYGLVLCPVALSYVQWPRPMSHGLSHVPWPKFQGHVGTPPRWFKKPLSCLVSSQFLNFLISDVRVQGLNVYLSFFFYAYFYLFPFLKINLLIVDVPVRTHGGKFV